MPGTIFMAFMRSVERDRCSFVYSVFFIYIHFFFLFFPATVTFCAQVHKLFCYQNPKRSQGASAQLQLQNAPGPLWLSVSVSVSVSVASTGLPGQSFLLACPLVSDRHLLGWPLSPVLLPIIST